MRKNKHERRWVERGGTNHRPMKSKNVVDRVLKFSGFETTVAGKSAFSTPYVIVKDIHCRSFKNDEKKILWGKSLFPAKTRGTIHIALNLLRSGSEMAQIERSLMCVGEQDACLENTVRCTHMTHANLDMCMHIQPMAMTPLACQNGNCTVGKIKWSVCHFCVVYIAENV